MDFGIILQQKNPVDRAVWLRSMVDRGSVDKRAQRRLADARCASARAHQCSPAAVESGEPDEAVLEGCSLEHERRQRSGATTKKTGGGLSSLRGQRKA
jgi:hypothetical protein